MPANLENAAVAVRLEKVSFHSNPKESNAKECSKYGTIALISHPSIYIWEFSVHVLLKSGLENFEHYFTSM